MDQFMEGALISLRVFYASWSTALIQLSTNIDESKEHQNGLSRLLSVPRFHKGIWKNKMSFGFPFLILFFSLLTEHCCCCCWVTSVLSNSVRPHRRQPTRLPRLPGILQARTLQWAAISFSNAWKWKVKVKSFSRVRPSATPWTAAFQVPPSMQFSRQEYWSGVPLPSPKANVKNQSLVRKSVVLKFFLYSGFPLPDLSPTGSWHNWHKVSLQVERKKLLG